MSGAGEYVLVPKELLAEVLDGAYENIWRVCGQFCVSTDVDVDGRHFCDKDQEKIDELRRFAGLIEVPE